jgi:hypothetical protein
MNTNTHLDKVFEFGCICIADIHHFIEMTKLAPSRETLSSLPQQILKVSTISGTARLGQPRTADQLLLVHPAHIA